MVEGVVCLAYRLAAAGDTATVGTLLRLSRGCRARLYRESCMWAALSEKLFGMRAPDRTAFVERASRRVSARAKRLNSLGVALVVDNRNRGDKVVTAVLAPGRDGAYF